MARDEREENREKEELGEIPGRKSFLELCEPRNHKLVVLALRTGC